MALGNRESHPTYRILKGKLKDAGFPVLAANLMVRRPVPMIVGDQVVKRLPNGLRVGIFGLAPQMTAPESWWSRFTDYVFDDPFKTAAGLVKKMRPECDLVVCLAHLGDECDVKLAEVPGIDVIVGGHAHSQVSEPLRLGNALLIRTGSHGKSLGRLDLEIEEGQIRSARGEAIPL